MLSILRPGGRFYLIFPQYFQPFEHHLGLVTKVPGLQYLFSGKTLSRAHSEIIEKRPGASWYYRLPDLQSWERCHTINGTSIRQFNKLVRESGFLCVQRIDPPLFSVGRNATKLPVAKFASRICRPLQRVPLLEETVTHRIVRVLEKRH